MQVPLLDLKAQYRPIKADVELTLALADNLGITLAQQEYVVSTLATFYK